VEKYNRRVSPHERILRFRLVPDEWSPATGELSPTLKLKRQVITGKYRELLDEVYRH
jgi:long-chain acyl-CoA synthetase